MGIPEPELKRTHHRAYDYFNNLRPALAGRSGYKKYIEPAGGPFYAVYNIGSYTFRPFRVVRREQASTLQACVVSTAADGRLIIPDHKLTILGFDSEEDAHFMCALLNCSPVQSAVRAYSIEVQISTHVASFLAFPRFDSKQVLHREIERIGKACHFAAQSQNVNRLSELESQLDHECAKVWGLDAEELKQMQDSLTVIARSEDANRDDED